MRNCNIIHPNYLTTTYDQELFLSTIMHYLKASVKISTPKYEPGDPDMEIFIPYINERNYPEFIINEDMAPTKIVDVFRNLGFTFDAKNKRWYLQKATSYWTRIRKMYYDCLHLGINGFINKITSPPTNTYLSFLFNSRPDFLHAHDIHKHTPTGEKVIEGYNICIPEITNNNYHNFVSIKVNSRDAIESELIKHGFKYDADKRHWEKFINITEYYEIIRTPH